MFQKHVWTHFEKGAKSAPWLSISTTRDLRAAALAAEAAGEPTQYSNASAESNEIEGRRLQRLEEYVFTVQCGSNDELISPWNPLRDRPTHSNLPQEAGSFLWAQQWWRVEVRRDNLTPVLLQHHRRPVNVIAFIDDASLLLLAPPPRLSRKQNSLFWTLKATQKRFSSFRVVFIVDPHRCQNPFSDVLLTNSDFSAASLHN